MAKLRLDTRVGLSQGDYDAVTPTQARLANDLSLFDSFMPAAPVASVAQSSQPMPEDEAPIPPPKDVSRVFIHPAFQQQQPPQQQQHQHQQHQSHPVHAIATASVPSGNEYAQTASYSTGQLSRQNSYTERRANAHEPLVSPGVELSQLQTRAIGSASPSNSFTAPALDQQPFSHENSAYYAYPRAAGDAPLQSQSHSNIGWVSLRSADQKKVADATRVCKNRLTPALIQL